MIRNTLISLAFLLLSLPMVTAANEMELPELGDSSATSLTPEQERQIGREVLRRMRHGGYIIDDPLVKSYIEDVGRALAIHAQSEHEFTFFVVDAPGINAFALPGGYIGIHSGLILASRDESELASVIAHEVAHVSQHHLARGVEQANRMNLPLTVALIAAILLGGDDPNVVNAAMAASMGGSAQMQLNFSRAHEHEADRVGMQLLANSDFDPQGMAAFFARLQEESRYYGDGVPEFLRTHPVTTSRLAEAQSAAERYPRKMRTDSVDYQVARARVRLHHSKNASELMKALNNKPGPAAEQLSAADNYLKAITLISLQQPLEAERLLQQLLNKQPGSIAYRETLGQLQRTQGNYQAALSLYQDGLKRYPNNELLSLSLVDTLVALKHYPQARESLQTILRLHPSSVAAYRRLAEVEAKSGNQAASHLAQAEYYLLMGEPHSALEQLNLANRLKNLDFYLSSRIEALSNDIKDELERAKSLALE